MLSDDVREGEDRAKFTEISEKFQEVETQFSALREIVNIHCENMKEDILKIEKWLEEWNKEVPKLNATQNAKIEFLEKMLIELQKEIKEIKQL